MQGIRTHFAGEQAWMHNLGDAFVPHILEAFGFSCLRRKAPDEEVVNAGRCLLVIGSLLTAGDLHRLDMPVDIWGCGWKGAEAMGLVDLDIRFHAVRGPLTAKGLGLGPEVALGDPALLVPHLFPRPRAVHQKSILIPHLDRLHVRSGAARARAAGCDELRSTLVFAAPDIASLQRLSLGGSLRDLWHWPRYREAGAHSLWNTLDLIAGASFVLTGSLHGAILAQAYGVPWAAFSDGYVDAPPKWADWAAYLGVELSFVRNLAEGRAWWAEQGRFARLRPLRPLLESFPYYAASPRARQLAATIDGAVLPARAGS